MVSRIFKGTAALVATLSLASAASANCGTSLYCGDAAAGVQPLSSWSSQSGSSWENQAAVTYESSSSSSDYMPSASYASSSAWTPTESYASSSSTWAPSTSHSSTMSSYEADSSYGTGSISEAYSAAPSSTYSSYGSSTASCPSGTQASTSEGQIIGCYSTSRPVATTTYQRVVRPVVYVRYPVPVAVPYTSPCHTVKHYSRYGGLNTNTGRRSCGGY